jgi:DNA-binding transcriptional MerR regulator
MVMTENRNGNGLRTIGTVAEEVGVSLTTLRLLEAQANILPYRTDTNLRLYDDQMVTALCAFRQAQQERKTRRGREMAGAA